MIAIIDYGMGNLRSVQKAFEFVGFDAQITDSKKKIREASHIVLPGVGAIADAMKNLEQRGLVGEIKRQIKAGKYFLGICLGMQLMLEKSYENGQYECMSLIKGEVVPFDVQNLRVPHMCWNTLKINDNELFCTTQKEQFVYFVHSYHAQNVPQENILATTNYGYDFVSAIQKDNMSGLQFHPEKSGETGLAMMKNFGGLK
ncbi:MAG: imidazole glycerol phosphate synthase subunit HisH [Christensenellaceae bacterium]